MKQIEYHGLAKCPSCGNLLLVYNTKKLANGETRRYLICKSCRGHFQASTFGSRNFS